MEQIVKKVLRKIESNGYEAYLVGGYVRDLLLGKKTYDVDICTNALPKELIKIFPSSQNNKYGGVNFKLKKFNFDITTYRKEIKYQSRKPIEIEYINNLVEDIQRRDFKINAVCMNSKGYVIDIIGGIEDIENKVITTIGDASIKLQEDPLRILRAIRFMSILDFKISADLEKQINAHKTKILTLSNERIKEELDKILTNRNALIGMDYLNKSEILKMLNISYQRLTVINDPLGMWAQLDFEFNSAFTKEEKKHIINIRKILEAREVNEITIFNYGLYLSLVAGEVLGISKYYINKLYKRMPIHSKKEINFTSRDIIEILDLKPCDVISKILDDITEKILLKKIRNNYQDIKKYITNEKDRWI